MSGLACNVNLASEMDHTVTVVTHDIITHCSLDAENARGMGSTLA